MSTFSNGASARGLRGLVAVGALAVSLHPGVSIAQTPPKFDAESARTKIRSAQPADIEAGLDSVEAAGDAAAAVLPDVEKRLRAGLPTALTLKAFAALEAIGKKSSSKSVGPYLRHRTPEIRRAAVRTLAETGGPDATTAFLSGLRSSDGMVRGFSATGLGSLGAKEALPDLFLALDHNVTEAAASIGQLCEPTDCRAFTDRLGKVGFDVMTSGFDPMLFRAEPLPESEQLRIIGVIREIGTKEAGQYLVDVQSRWPAHYSKKVKQAIDTAIPSIPGATEGAQ